MMMRYIPHTSQNVEEMLKTIGVPSLDNLFESIPKKYRQTEPLNLPNTLSEIELRSHIEKIAHQNEAAAFTSFLGAGCYRHFIPAVVNYLASQGGFLTAYTPYQPEISQGTLQATFEFQTMMARLTGMEAANASMYDGATALAEACLMAKRLKPKKKAILVPRNIHPEYRAVCQTYLEAQDVELIPVAYDSQTGSVDLEALAKKTNSECMAIVTQTPNFFGVLEELDAIQKICKNNDALFIVAVTEPLSLALIKSPGQSGADMVVGEAQSFGNPPSFGGPHVGFFATRHAFVRALPGRVVGETTDNQGQRCYTLTLSTREQHIRREKATSNICTNEAWLATRAAIYLSTVGEQGLKKCAKWNHTLANELVARMKNKAKLRFSAPFFNEIVIEPEKSVDHLQKNLLNQKILGGVSIEKDYPELKNCLLVCVTELNTPEQIHALCEAL